MKCVDAIIRPEKLDDVKEQLIGIGVDGMTIREVRGFGRRETHTEFYRGAEYKVDFIPKVQLTILASDDLVPDILDAILAGAHTGKFGDGKIFVTHVEEVIPIRTAAAAARARVGRP